MSRSRVVEPNGADGGALRRPQPPPHLLDAASAGPAFAPDAALRDWIVRTFVQPDGVLANDDHRHLLPARIGCLWTRVACTRHGRRIVGQCEFRPPGGGFGRWQRARAEQQIIEWFGTPIDFLLTFDAAYASACTDAEFCALVEHELYHAGQACDASGAPKFAADTGIPVFALRAHDVEQFLGVVRRYGADVAGVRNLIEAAQSDPIATPTQIGIACGTCRR
jgi:hypothetical protein